MTIDLKQLYLNLLLGFKVIEYYKLENLVYYKILLTGPISQPPNDTTVYLNE